VTAAEPGGTSARESELLASLTPSLTPAGSHGVLVGAGDDAAVVHPPRAAMAITSDVVVEGVHFRRELSAWDDVGWKAVAVNCSDLAAMGASPGGAVVAVTGAGRLDGDALKGLYSGLAGAAQRWGLALVGGDTVAAGSELTVSVTAWGELVARDAMTRAGAHAGQQVICVGPLGAGAAALAQFAAGATPDPSLLASHRRPHALVAAGCELARVGASACIDVSDGLGLDLARVCAASGVRTELWQDRLPIADGVAEAAEALGSDLLALACGGGEDFSLVATATAGEAEQLARAAGVADGVAAAVIGEVHQPEPGQPLVSMYTARGDVDISTLGYDHFWSS
jgi:thiamine-monophosphate kinase